ncbi:MAG: AmmeMemoRadiSam system radical SAM enzyme [Bacteroidales bacterium]|nr:MAG: AmmeMemoRadiSam system radical SAM enzyme [Bacteroidales bacterium]
MESKYYIKTENNTVECQLCPHFCIIRKGRLGVCNTRLNTDGVLQSVQWGVIASSSLDPIEKKPLFHFFPGKMIYSIGGFGCNLSCLFCQNFEISQYVPQNIDKLRIITPSEIVQKAKIHPNNIGIAYTYNEPTISIEYILETAELIRHEGMKNVIVSNGFINPEPLSALLELIDAFNIDLKAFSDDFYKKITKGSLKPVLNSLKAIRESGKHLELAFLVIPNLNDDLNEASLMFNWIANELGEHTVLHINGYHPAYLLNNQSTKAITLHTLYQLAKERLHYVYIGNNQCIDNELSTKCPKCESVVIKRSIYNASPMGIDQKGYCAGCGFGPIVTL